MSSARINVVEQFWDATRDDLSDELRQRLLGDTDNFRWVKEDTLAAYCEEMGVEYISRDKRSLRRAIRRDCPTMDTERGGKRLNSPEMKEMIAWLELGDDLEDVPNVGGYDR